MDAPTIRLELKTGRYYYLWLKHVTGFDPEQHCARGLLGPYERLWPSRGRKAGDVYAGPLEGRGAPFLYLCGVTSRWADNLHLAMAPAPGESIRLETPDAIVEVVGMRRLEIPEIPPGECDKTREFTTCRNYRFGWHYFPDRPAPAAGGRQLALGLG